MQNLVISLNIKGIGLGDRIDWLCTANMIALRENDMCVSIYKELAFIGWEEISSLFKPIEMSLKLLPIYPSSSLNNLNYINYYTYNISEENKEYQDLLSFHKDFPKIKVKDYSEYFPDLPEKFVTMQWDANLKRRRCSKNKVKNITEFYENIGYKTIIVGGQAENDTLRNDLHKIAYIMSKASLHAGVDSGFMHLAKIVMPSNKIHIYTSNFMDPYISHHLKNVLKAGAVLNYSRYK